MTTPEIIITVLLSLLGAALIILTIWLFLASSRRPSKKTELIKHTRFAHRGLHGDGAPENSMTAFRRAIDEGYGIEIDIRLANDGVLVVHHDPTLLRVCGLDKKVIDVSSRELSSVKLGDSNDTVPTFRELLDTVGGRVPLLIEIKSDIHEKGVSEQFVKEIDGYNGEFLVQSFNPLALRTVRRHRPDIPLGILSTEYTKSDKFRGKPLYRALERLLFNFLIRPDFIAYDQHGYDVRALKMLRKLYKTPTLAWTVRSQDEEDAARAHGFDNVIFEGYIPNSASEDTI